MRTALTLITALLLLFCGEANAVQDINYRYPKNHVVTIDGKFLGACLRESMANSRLPVSYSTRAIYSDNFRKNKPCEMTPWQLMTYLTAESARCDFETGREPALKAWILLQKDNSIDPVKIFETSLRLNNGRVFDAVLTIHQLLRNEARWWSTSYYKYSSNEKAADQFWNKFIDIRGSLAARNETRFNGDHEGSWYRIWGIMLPRLFDHANPTQTNVCARFGESVASSVMSRVRAVGAEASKYIFDLVPSVYRAGGDRRGKMLTNVAGADAGEILISKVWRMPWFKPEMCKSEGYLKRAVFDF